MKTFLIDPRNTTKPYNFCLLSALSNKKYPFRFLGYIPKEWRDKSPLKGYNLFLPLSRGAFENLQVQKLTSGFTKHLEMFLGYTRIRGKIDEKSIIHFLWFTTPTLEKYILPHLPAGRILHTAHNLLPHGDHILDFQTFKNIYSLMDTILVHDNETKNKLEKSFKLPIPVIKMPHGNLELFYNTFDTSSDSESKRFYSQNLPNVKKPTFLFMGPIKKYKGFETLISAVQLLNDKNFSYSVIIKSKKVKKIKNIHFLPFSASYSNLGLIYRNVDAVILPHTNVSQSITLFEAGYFKKPVIVSDSGGLKETVRDKKDGFIFRKGKPEELAEKMKHLINANSRQITSMGENFKEQLIKEYSWSSITENLIKIYEGREESLN